MLPVPRWSLLLLIAAPLGAQRVPLVTLSRVEAELSQPFSQIDGVRELRDGRVIVLDTRDRVVQLVDLARGTMAQIGRHGSGPGEYRAPVRLFAIGGDSSAIFDGGNSRIMVILPDGRPGPAAPVVVKASQMASMSVSQRYVPEASDTTGRLYRRTGILVFTPEGPKRPDTAAIERWDRARDRHEIIAPLRMRFVPSGRWNGPPELHVMGPSMPFTNGDGWAVAPDGRVAIVRYENYRVEYVLPTGERVVGPSIPWQPIRVAEGHKEEWREEQERNARGAPDDGPEQKEWPELLPPFLGGAASFAPDGMLWVKRTTVAGGPATYDVIDPAGRVVRQVVLRAGSRVVGFGNRSVFVSRYDQDDLQYLQRYSLPRF
ncbi:MAG TPA: hypothetical protein VLE53_01745 [Gemmatimonadaceae bacterium]|nr:hypothetical protein [Gemmatimonadaceae bacterium]